MILVALVESSFNPCFSGSGALARVAIVPALQPGSSFNPCFSGSGALATSTSDDSLRYDDVSILVFLDLGLWHRSMRRAQIVVGGFNPCFSGSGALASIDASSTDRCWWFQSLFFWIWGSGSLRPSRCSLKFPVSILVFLDLGLWPGIVASLVRPSLAVSILVFLDLGLWPSRAPSSRASEHVSILVFLDLGLWRRMRRKRL